MFAKRLFQSTLILILLVSLLHYPMAVPQLAVVYLAVAQLVMAQDGL